MACKVSLQSLLATLIAISVANNGNGSAQVAGRCIAYVRPDTRIPSALLHVVPMPAWEQRKFSEIVDVCSGRDYKHLDEGPIPVYGTGGYMTSVSEALSHNRDAIGIGRKGTIDKPYLLKAPFWTVDTLFYAIPKSDINLEFALCSFLNVDWKSKDESTGLPSLSKESINETVLSVPNVVEQNHLGNFFADLDRLITLHQRKYDKLVILKKSMLEKMFPKDGESVPEIRFAGFTDPWEQRKFVDFVEASGIRNKDNLQLESYSVSNDRGFVPQDEQFENGGTMRDADKTAYWIVEPGSFAYNPARINVGSIGYQSTRKNVIVSSLYEVFKTDRSCDDRFLWHWFKSSLFTKQIEMLQEGGVRLYFFFDKLQKSEIWMPNVDEQRIIGQQFDQLDSLITLHQRKRLSIRQRSPVWS